MRTLIFQLSILSSFLGAASISVSEGATFITRVVFDDYRDPFDTTGLVGPPIVIKAYPDPLPSSQMVTTTLTSPDTAGATRVATLTHLNPTIEPGVIKGNSSAIIFSEKLAFGTDTNSPTLLTVHYDFTTIPGSDGLDAGTGNDHMVISVFDTDGGDNDVRASLLVKDLDGSLFEDDLADLGIDIQTLGEHYIPFSAFTDINFEELTEFQLQWESRGLAQFDGVLSFAGAGTFSTVSNAVPEPGFLFPLAGLATAFLGWRRKPRDQD